MFVSPAFAQAGEVAAQTSSYGVIIQLVAIFAVFYLLLIRPQQKRIKQHEALLSTIKKGDQIVTGGGIYGKVTDASDAVELKVEIAEGIVVKINRGMVRDVIGAQTNNEAKKADVKKDVKKKAANTNKTKSKK